MARSKAVGGLRDEVKAAVLEKFPEADKFAINQAFDYVQKKSFRSNILDKQKRVDGRGYDDLRKITCEVGVLPRAHGSAIFQRGETQAVTLATLGTGDDAQEFDSYTGGETEKKFILHYNFPTFPSAKPAASAVRAVAKSATALWRNVPSSRCCRRDYPYAIRVTSEIMESNGSTSMACVCGGTLALMDAGVPMIRPVAGISVGICAEHDADKKISRYKLLTDIIGWEDHYCDMDCKIAGTEKGITGFQLDLKLRA